MNHLFFFLFNKDYSELKLNRLPSTCVDKESSANFCPAQKVISDAYFEPQPISTILVHHVCGDLSECEREWTGKEQYDDAFEFIFNIPCPSETVTSCMSFTLTLVPTFIFITHFVFKPERASASSGPSDR